MLAHDLAHQLLAGPNLPVHLSYNYGDHWRTTVAPEITEATEGTVRYSQYHQMDKLVEEELGEGEKDGTRQTIILS
jgi:hypothetical protein